MSTKPRLDNSVNAVRSKQDLSCNWTGTADFGRIVPFDVQEILAGDKVITCKPNIELQMLPLASPTFGKMDLYVHYFFVPTRLIWKDAMNFFDQTGPGKNAIPPYLTAEQLRTIYKSDLSISRPLYKHWTSLGLPPFFALVDAHAPANLSQINISLLKFRAYERIWWDFYRDPEVIRDESITQYLDDSSGHKSDVNYVNFLLPRVRCIKDNWIASLFASPGFSPSEFHPTGFPGSYDFEVLNASGSVINPTENETTEVLDGGYNTASSSRMARLVEALTRLSERLSLSGKREIDAFFARYGAKPNWLEMNMCRYLGGAKSTVLVSDITSSADTSTMDDAYGKGTPLGAKAATGYSRFNELNIEFTADEPGYLMGCFSVMPHIHYVQGLDKSWIRNLLTDWFQKTLEHTGNVAVSKIEVGMNHRGGPDYDSTKDFLSFAFRDPYYEYKVGRDILAGDFMLYHNSSDSTPDGTLIPSLQYMQSMEQYINFPTDRDFNAQNLLVDGLAFNKIFYYLGGSIWADVDDHFHLCVDKTCIIERPMDGFAIPTLETTEDPHNGKSALPNSTVL